MVITKQISMQTKGECDIVDITSLVQQRLSETEIKSGTVTVFITGSTAGVTTIENEPGLVSDLKDMWERLIPKNADYRHDRAWGDGNGYSHVRASLLGASLVIPFNDKKLSMGTWQQLVVVDFDNRPRSRQVLLQIMGEQ
jgi:secondary thiamine-phosphate synthase enzyme